MMQAVSATYDGEKVVFDENVNLLTGQKVIVTILEDDVDDTPKKKKIDFAKYVGSAGKMFANDEEIDEYVRSLRKNDRI